MRVARPGFLELGQSRWATRPPRKHDAGKARWDDFMTELRADAGSQQTIVFEKRGSEDLPLNCPVPQMLVSIRR